MESFAILDDILKRQAICIINVSKTLLYFTLSNCLAAIISFFLFSPLIFFMLFYVKAFKISHVSYRSYANVFIFFLHRFLLIINVKCIDKDKP